MIDLSNPPPEIDDLEERAEQVLFETQTVFPFTIFPTKIIVDKIKVTIKKTGLPGMVEIFPIKFENILTTTVNTSLLFGTVGFDLINYEKNPEPVRFLPISDALKLQQLLTGIILLKKEGTEIDHIRENELVDKAQAIGDTHA